MRHLITAITLTIAFNARAGGGVGPATMPSEVKSTSAKQAVERHRLAIKQADAAHRAMCVDATRKLIDDLTAARREAMRADNLPEANAIDERLKRAKAELELLLQPPNRTTGALSKPALNIEGTYRYTNAGDRVGLIVISDTTVAHPASNTSAPYERIGNEIRATWPGGWSERMVFSGDGKYTMEHWAKGRKPFEGGPTLTGEGVRVEPEDAGAGERKSKAAASRPR